MEETRRAKMDLPEEIEEFIKETIADSLGLPVSAQTVRLKLLAYEEANRRLRDQYLLLLEKSTHKDQLIDRAKAEASMNAVALKKFVEENQRLAAECANLVEQCQKWERECSLYDHDREALMDFGNEADERAKEAEGRVRELEEQLGTLSKELKFYRHEYETRSGDSSAESNDLEESSLESILATLVSKDEVDSGYAFLEIYKGYEACQRLLNMWDSLRPSTRKALSVAAKTKALEKDKEHLRINLSRAEEEAKLLFKENSILDEENKGLLRQCHKEINIVGSGERQTSSASAKRNKRKLSPGISSPIEMKVDVKDVDLLRQPLSPLLQNSPEIRIQKK